MKIIFKFFLVLYLIVGIVPNLEALDKVTTQWLYLNCLNTIALIFFFLKDFHLKKYLFNKSSILFFCLLVWSTITIFFSINAMESFVVLSQFFAMTIGFVIILVCVSKIDNTFKFISDVISIYLIIELIYIYLPFLRDLEIAKTYMFSRSALFLGFAANVNITAFSIIYKIPFFIYSIIQLKKFNGISIILSFFIFSLVIFASGTLNSTRGAILTYSSLSPILLVIGLIVYLKSKHNKLLIVSFSYIFSLILSFPLNSLLSKSFGRAESNIVNRISSLNALVDDEKQKDGSLTQRVNFYSQAAKFILKNPIFGTGLGNWKIKSIDTNKENIIGYMVPYHVHNDYLEIATEIGLVGLFIYLAILFLGFKDEIIKFLNIIFTSSRLKEHYLITITIAIFFYIYFIDSNINFPFHRPIVFINLLVILGFLNAKKEITLNE